MARETKVGLLAGLAFIICFAVILANRGGDESFLPRNLSNLATGGSRGLGLPDSTTSLASRGADRPGNLPYPNTGLVRVDLPAASEAANGNSKIPQAVTPSVSRHAVTDRNEGEKPAPVPAVASKPDVHPLSNAVQPGSVDSVHPDTPASGQRKYTVAAGDTLWKIAAAQYGSKSAALVDAIFEANRTELKGRDELRTGMEIVLPSAPAQGTKPTTVAATPTANAKTESKPTRVDRPIEPAVTKTVDPSSKNARWYQVKPGDRYISIARDILGDGNRWKEIHELNKDRFADPAMIREGVRIRIPGLEMASARDRRR